MKTNQDAYGKQLLAQYLGTTPTAEIIERDDNFIATGSDIGMYFTEYEEWGALEQKAIAKVHGKTLDIGCGAGRHSLYLQEKGFDVTGIDNSPGAVKVCKMRGLKKAFVRPIEQIDKFRQNSFETIIMFGNNFGLFGSRDNARSLLQKMSLITKPNAQIIAGTMNPYQTTNEDHLSYHKLNRRRGRMGGQIRLRVRYGKTVGEWLDYLFVSPDEMEEILGKTDWQIKEFLTSDSPNYVAVIEKNQNSFCI